MPLKWIPSPARARRALSAVVLLLVAARCGSTSEQVHHPSVEERREATRIVARETRAEMVRFEDEGELRAMLERLAEAQRLRRPRYRAAGGDVETAQAEAAPAAAEAGGESITNNQEQGVDEGGIVKTHCDHLVVLRRGRLWTAEIGDQQLRPLSMVDLRPSENHDPHQADDWDSVMEATDIYRPIQPTESPVLHTVVTCELSRGFACHAQGIIGP